MVYRSRTEGPRGEDAQPNERIAKSGRHITPPVLSRTRGGPRGFRIFGRGSGSNLTHGSASSTRWINPQHPNHAGSSSWHARYTTCTPAPAPQHHTSGPSSHAQSLEKPPVPSQTDSQVVSGVSQVANQSAADSLDSRDLSTALQVSTHAHANHAANGAKMANRDCPPSPKRRRHDSILASSSLEPISAPPMQSSSQNTHLVAKVRIKQERSPSPHLQPMARLVTSGSKFITPVPASCIKGHANYVEERKKWAKKEVLQLRHLGIRHEKVFVRDDGMVIDWVSPVPVWSDTLLREARIMHGASSSVLDILNTRARSAVTQSSASPPGPSIPEDMSTANPHNIAINTLIDKNPPQPLGNLDSPVSSRDETVEDDRSGEADPIYAVPTVASSSHPNRLKRGLNPPSGNSALDPISIDDDVILPVPSEVVNPRNAIVTSGEPVADAQLFNSADAQRDAQNRDMESLEDSALDFFQQYVKAFDSDRASLASAYSRLATFSYCIHDTISRKSLGAAFLPSGGVERFASRKESRNLYNKTEGHLQTNRADIVIALLSLGPHKFCPRGAEQITYDVIYLASHFSVLLICHGHLIDIERNHRIAFDQSFLLRKKEDDEEDRITDGLWPLVAVSHQWVVRDLLPH